MTAIEFVNVLKMVDLVKGLTEVPKDKVNLLTLYELSGQVFNKLYQLGFT